MKKKVLLTATVQSHICQFHLPFIKMLQDEGYEIHVAAKNNLAEKNGLQLLYADKVFDVPFSRSPISKRNIEAYKMLKQIVKDNGYSVISCNTPMGGVVSRLIARKYRKAGMKVIYTAHGFHFYRGASKLNWLIYYPIEKFLARYTDYLITINLEDYEFAQKKLKAGNIKYIPGIGVDTNKFDSVAINKEEKRKELNLPEESVLLLSIGELNENKNHETILEAIAKCKNKTLHYAICGNGPLDAHLKNKAKALGILERVHFLGYRRDVPEILKASDIFCFPSKREGLSLALMETMSSGLPVICSKIRGNVDQIAAGKGGFLLEPSDANGFAEAVDQLVDDPKLRKSMGEYNKKAVKTFDLSIVKEKLKEIYLETLV